MKTVVVLLLAAALGGCDNAPEFDVVVANGTVYDGSGTLDGVRRADVGIIGDRIRAIGDLSNRTARQVVDASGRAVAPGFINAFSRAGASLLADGSGESDIRQGITTEILVDGGPAYWTPSTTPPDQQALLARFGVTLQRNDRATYVDQLLSRGTSENVALLVPITAGGTAPLDEAALERQMQAGAFGVSVDWDQPGTPTLNPGQLGALARVVARDGGVYVSTIRTGVPIGQGVADVVAIAAPARAPLVVAGIDEAASLQPGSINTALPAFRDAASRGVAVAATIGGYIDNEADRKAIVGWAGAMIGTASLSLRTHGALTAVPHDAAAFGAFPHYLGTYAREERLVELREAIRRITGFAAAQYHLSGRGFIRENNFADVVVFDPMTIAARATAAQPNQYPAGIDYVIVNGVVVVTPKGHSGAHPGRVLAGPAARPPS